MEGRKIKILNALPIAAVQLPATIVAREVSVQEARRILEEKGFMSFIGHEATARLLSQLFGVAIQFNRGMAEIQRGDTLLICSLKVRLQEGEIKQSLSDEEVKLIICEVME